MGFDYQDEAPRWWGNWSVSAEALRPTGRLHIGHYFGALQNWVRLQNDPAYECFYFIADWHALTSDYADTSGVAENTLQIMIDYLAAGLDPQKSVIFQQSAVPEHAELHLLLSMVTPLGWLERVPTYKEALENVKDKDLHNYGFLGYPVLQTADIVIYSKEGVPLVVPVGEDQVSHVELSREIVRRFNSFNGLFFKDEFFCNWEQFRVLKAQEWFSNPILQTIAQEVIANKGSIAPEDKAPIVSALKRRASEVGLQNFLENFGPGREFLVFQQVLEEPQVMLTKTPRIPGLDGNCSRPKSPGAWSGCGKAARPRGSAASNAKRQWRRI